MMGADVFLLFVDLNAMKVGCAEVTEPVPVRNPYSW